MGSLYCHLRSSYHFAERARMLTPVCWHDLLHSLGRPNP